MNTLLFHVAARWRAACLAVAATLCIFAPAMAAAEPTLDQVYQEARAGHVDHALQMMQPVLQAHPNSAKAHYVEAELLAREGRVGPARDALSDAERLAPGLPFADADSVRQLRRQLSGATPGAFGDTVAPTRTAVAPAHGTAPWGILAALCGGALLAWALMRLGRPAASGFIAPAPPTPPGGGAAPTWPAYGTATAPAAASPVATSPVAGGLASGLATGLGVGAGVVAAEAIGHALFGHERHEPTLSGPFAPSPDAIAFEPLDRTTDADLGGTDFGIRDASSWDDGGGGGDWDA